MKNVIGQGVVQEDEKLIEIFKKKKRSKDIQRKRRKEEWKAKKKIKEI